MLEDGLTSEQDAGRAGEEVEVLDVAQLLLASVKGEGKKTKPEAKSAAAKAAPATEETAPTTAAPVDSTTEASKPAASGGSLFDAAPATEEKPAKPAESGGSLFDTPAPEKPAAKPAESGGSLFDTPAPEADKPTEQAAEPKAGATEA